MNSLFQLKQDIMQMAELGASAAVKALQPRADELTTNEAYSFAGRRWLEYQIRHGNIRGVKKGPARNSPVVFSRFEIMALKKAESAEFEIKERRRAL